MKLKVFFDYRKINIIYKVSVCLCVCLCQIITKTTAQCQVFEFTKRAFIFKKKKKKKKKISISYLINFSSIRPQRNSNQLQIVQCYYYSVITWLFCTIALYLFPLAAFSIYPFNGKQMVALFRLSSIQLTHCMLLLYNRLVRTKMRVRFMFKCSIFILV